MRNALRQVWERFAAGVEAALRYAVRETNPRHAVAAYLALNAVLTALALRLTASWADFFTASGYGVTATGFALAVVELYRTRTAAESRLAGRYRDQLERARESLNAARTAVTSRQWVAAVVRLDDLVGHLSALGAAPAGAGGDWGAHQVAASRFASEFAEGSNGRRLAYNAPQWGEFVRALLGRLDRGLERSRAGEL